MCRRDGSSIHNARVANLARRSGVVDARDLFQRPSETGQITRVYWTADSVSEQFPAARQTGAQRRGRGDRDHEQHQPSGCGGDGDRRVAVVVVTVA